MSEEQFTRVEPGAAVSPVRVDDAAALISATRQLPRAPRIPTRTRSYCAETAWVWQRARLLCAPKDPTR